MRHLDGALGYLNQELLAGSWSLGFVTEKYELKNLDQLRVNQKSGGLNYVIYFFSSGLLLLIPPHTD